MRRLLPLLALTLLACESGPPPLRIGYKPFTEQRILANMLQVMVRDAGYRVAPLVDCGDTWQCQQLLRDGRLDLMVDYTGTALNFVGAAPGPHTLARVQALYAPLGQRWLPTLGFDNGYRVLAAPTDPAQSLTDLGGREALRVACPAEYSRRPRDGLAALAGRYGLRLAPRPVLIEDPGERYRAVLEGRADVAIGYATDAAINDLGLKALRDPLRFFPAYEGAITVRVAAADARPGLEAVLGKLSGALDTAEMRRLNGQAQIMGVAPRTVAGRWLVAQKFLDPDRAVDAKRPVAVVAVPEADGLEEAVRRARRALREAFPERAVRRKAEVDPVAAVRDGRAWLAVIGAERFYRDRLRDRLSGRPGSQLEPGIEAVAVLGERALHVVRRADDIVGGLGGRLGGPPKGSGGHRLALRAAQGRSVTLTRTAPASELLQAVRQGQLDGALVVAEPGDPELVATLAQGGLAVVPWPDARQAPVRLPFARVVRIPAATYAGQREPVETLSAQVLLVGPARQGALAEAGGPAGPLGATAAPVSVAEARAIAEATGVFEAPDPGLPTAWRGGAVSVPVSAGQHVLETMLNLLVLLFTAWVVLLTLRREA